MRSSTALLCIWAALQLALAGFFVSKLRKLWLARQMRDDWLPLSFSLACAALGVAMSSFVTWSCADAKKAQEVLVITGTVCLLWTINVFPIFVA